MNSFSDFWNVEVERVPHMTGARTVMDGSDLRQILQRFDFDLHDKYVIDVGCGTGRLKQLCGGYHGFDITPSMVEYTRQQNIAADSMEEFDTDLKADVICCFSVFTHIPREERQKYLAQFIKIAPTVIVDIVPGEEHGDIAIWYADAENFEQDIKDAGFTSFTSFLFGRIPEDGVDHRYYRLER